MSESIPSNIEWRKSSFSGSQGDECVEVADFSGTVGVRDSKNPGGAVLTFASKGWEAFIVGVRNGEFDIV